MAAAAAAAPARSITVSVLNGGETAGLAGRVSAALARTGYRAGLVANTSPRSTTAIRYGAGAAGNASTIAAMVGTTGTSPTPRSPYGWRGFGTSTISAPIIGTSDATGMR